MVEPDRAKAPDRPRPRIRLSRNGPYLVVIDDLTNSKGERLQGWNGVALCRCGASRRKPFCDGSHIRIGFSDERPDLAPEKLGDDRDAVAVVTRDGPQRAGEVSLPAFASHETAPTRFRGVKSTPRTGAKAPRASALLSAAAADRGTSRSATVRIAASGFRMTTTDQEIPGARQRVREATWGLHANTPQNLPDAFRYPFLRRHAVPDSPRAQGGAVPHPATRGFGRRRRRGPGAQRGHPGGPHRRAECGARVQTDAVFRPRPPGQRLSCRRENCAARARRK